MVFFLTIISDIMKNARCGLSFTSRVGHNVASTGNPYCYYEYDYAVPILMSFFPTLSLKTLKVFRNSTIVRNPVLSVDVSRVEGHISNTPSNSRYFTLDFNLAFRLHQSDSMNVTYTHPTSISDITFSSVNF